MESANSSYIPFLVSIFRVSVKSLWRIPSYQTLSLLSGSHESTLLPDMLRQHHSLSNIQLYIGGKTNSSDNKWYQPGHTLIKGEKKLCFMCQATKRKTRAGWFVYTRTKCVKCNVFLCKPGMLYNCYEEFHSQQCQFPDNRMPKTLEMVPPCSTTDSRKHSLHTEQHHQQALLSLSRLHAIQNAQSGHELPSGSSHSDNSCMIFSTSGMTGFQNPPHHLSTSRKTVFQNSPRSLIAPAQSAFQTAPSLHVVPNTDDRMFQYVTHSQEQVPHDEQQAVQTFMQISKNILPESKEGN